MVYVSGVIKFSTLSKNPHCDSVKKYATHFVTPEIWTHIMKVTNIDIWLSEQELSDFWLRFPALQLTSNVFIALESA